MALSTVQALEKTEVCRLYLKDDVVHVPI